MNARSLVWLFFSVHGRIGRAQWWLANAAIVATALPLVVLYFQPSLYAQYFAWAIILHLLTIYPAYAVDAKRFQDRGRSGFWAIFSAAPALLSDAYDLLLEVQHLLPFGRIYRDAEIEALLYGASIAILAWFIVDLGLARGMEKAKHDALDLNVTPALNTYHE